jgi:hypothetical protein
MVTRVPSSTSSSASFTRALPNGRVLALSCRNRRGRISSIFVSSLTCSGPMFTVCLNRLPGAGQLPSASRISRDPTTQ